jgi:RsiW-degrading membrane proteinase PrsW (M82 family)/DNA-directed RNA polymerase subunit RPC12/RpoP
MPQIIECPNCAKKLNAPDKLAGMRVACPACKAAVSIPPINAAPNQHAPRQQVNAQSRVAGTGTSSAAQPATAPSAVVIQCSHCSKKFKGSAQLQGKNIRCPACGRDFTARLQPVVTPPLKSPSAAQATTAPAIARPSGLPARSLASPLAVTAQPKPIAPKKSAVPTPARTLSFSGGRPRMLYLIFAMAFVPLVFQTFGSQGDLEERFTHTFASHPDIESKLETLKSKADLFALFPDGRIEGAHLSYFTRVHWIYATIAAAAFFGICWLLFDPGKATIPQWFIVFAVTATVGIVSLLAFQWIAAVTQGVWITGRSVLVILFYIVKFIGFSYSAAMDDDTGFLLSFFGFTCGVGLCEEVTKALPVIVWLGEDKKLDWRAACILGLASGIGFGVVEGIIYSGDHYNGVASADIYLTRFISCVALHATWTAAVCLMAVRNLSGFNTSEATDWTVHLLMIISVPAVMHGLYDTLLKKGFDGYALAVALASFAWLAFMLERARSSGEEYNPRRVIRAVA